MLKIRSRILERAMGSAATTLKEMRDIVGHAVKENRDHGNADRECSHAEALHITARELGISARRVAGIMRGEVGRVWADELEVARRWYAHHCDRMAQRGARDAVMFQARATAVRERLK